MGCNTSQELKTKESAIHVNTTSNGAEQNDENAVTEQNAINEVEQMPNVQKHSNNNGNALNMKRTSISNEMNSIMKATDEMIEQKFSLAAASVASATSSTTTRVIDNNHAVTNALSSNRPDPSIASINYNCQSTTATITNSINHDTKSMNGTNKEETVPAKENGSLPLGMNDAHSIPDDYLDHLDKDQNQEQDQDNEILQNGSNLADARMIADEEKAATKIQAVFRGHQVRNRTKIDTKIDTKATEIKVETGRTVAGSNYNNMASSVGGAKGEGKGSTAAATELHDPSKAELEAEFDPNDKELCDAAKKIQATFRGHLTRKLMNKDDDVDIQEITKKVAEELDIDLNDPELHKAATKIQASFRGHKIRKDIAPGHE